MTPSELRARLFELEDPAYREFHLRTCPQAEHLIGVRMPQQRKLAKEIVKSDQHYVEMAKAWLAAELFIKFRYETLDYLQRDQLSQFAHNKAIQKACESYRVSDADKQTLRGMKF